MDFHRGYGMEELAGYLRCKFSRPHKTPINPLNPNGRTRAINLPKTNRLRMGPHNILPILHNNNALQHANLILKNNPRPVLPRWRECLTFAYYTDDEIAGGAHFGV